MNSVKNDSKSGRACALPITKMIVDVHKGKIIVESERGKWIKFTVLLPG